MAGRAQHPLTVGVFIGLFVAMATGQTCQNGGTWNDSDYICICTPFFHGTQCQTAFSAVNPCDSAVPAFDDSAAVHKVDSSVECAGSDCVDFSGFTAGWYQVKSPAGDFLIETDGCLASGTICGSAGAHVLSQKTQEANPNVLLFSARAFKHLTVKTNCLSNDDPSYPVRILKCSATKTLYFLLPLLSKYHHYCIGNKQKCSDGFRSIDGSDYEPCTNATCTPERTQNFTKPMLSIRSLELGRHTDRDFYCTVHDAFTSNFSGGVSYRVSYVFTFKNGTEILLNYGSCKDTNVTLDVGGRANISVCEGDDFFAHPGIRDGNVLGGSLRCTLQAKCNVDGARFNSEILHSNLHRFLFDFRYVSVNTSEETQAISPTQPVDLCVNSDRIPAPGQAFFTLSVATGRSVDIAVAALKNSTSAASDTVESQQCQAHVKILKRATKFCMRLQIHNFDPDNALPTNMNSYVSVVKVNISMKSNGQGINTNEKYILVEQVNLNVDLSSIYMERKDLMHIYSDPVMKPAHLSYSFGFGLWQEPSDKVLQVLSHKMHDYEIQVLIKARASDWYGHSAVTEVWIRYYKYRMVIRSKSSSSLLEYVAPTEESDLLVPLVDGVPQGVTIEGEGTSAMSVKLELYGTLIYVWGFIRYGWALATDCRSEFIKTRASVRQFKDDGSCGLFRAIVDGQNALDVMVMPGFRDIPAWVEGSIFANDAHETESKFFWYRNDQRSMFHQDYAIILKDASMTEILTLCRCGSESSSDSCVYGTQKITSRRRRAALDQPPTSARRIPRAVVESAAQATRNVTEAEANATCWQMVQEKIASLTTAITTCQNTMGILNQTDFVSQFIVVCTQYATTLGDFSYSESLLTSFLGMCASAISRDETLPDAAKLQLVTAINVELCPANCSGNGACVVGSCVCNAGFGGDDCRTLLNSTTQPSVFFVSSSVVECSDADCSGVIVSVTPSVTTADVTCRIEFESTSVSVRADALGISTFRCDVSRVFQWLRDNSRIHTTVSIAMQTPQSSSSNRTQHLLHVAKCNGADVTCDIGSMRCRTEETAENFCQSDGISIDVLVVSMTVLVFVVGVAVISVVISLVCRRRKSPAA